MQRVQDRRHLVVGLGDLQRHRGARSRQAGAGVRLALGARLRRSATRPQPPEPASTPRSPTARSRLPPTARCVFPDGQRSTAAPSAASTALTGDPGYATSVLFEQLVLTAEQPVDPKDVALGGARRVARPPSAAAGRAYYAALRAAHLTIADAHAIIVARLAARPRRGAVPSAAATPGADRGLPRDVRRPAGPARADDGEGAVARRPRAGLGRLDARARRRVRPRAARVRSTRPTARSRSRRSARSSRSRSSRAPRPGPPRRPRSSASRARSSTAAGSHGQEQQRLASAVCLNDRLPTPGATDLSAVRAVPAAELTCPAVVATAATLPVD